MVSFGMILENLGNSALNPMNSVFTTPVPTADGVSNGIMNAFGLNARSTSMTDSWGNNILNALFGKSASPPVPDQAAPGSTSAVLPDPP